MEIRDLTVDDLDAALDNRRRAFGIPYGLGKGEWRERVIPSLPQGRYLGVFDGGRMAAAGRIRDFTQWWHGRPVRMGGIASVTVAPEDRGRGVGRLLMRSLVERCADLGHPVSALFPATTPIYRAMGWEHAGVQQVVTLSAERLRTISVPDQVKLRRLGPDDAPEVIAVLGRVYAAARSSGPYAADEQFLRHVLADQDAFLYGADDGYAVYRWDGGRITVDNLVAGSEATARALWSMVGTSSSVSAEVRAAVAPDDPVFWLLRELSDLEVQQGRWMLRVIDVAAALSGRGFPPGIALDTVLEVADPVLPANSGRWRLRLADGAATAERVESGAGHRLTVNGLSALYAGVPLGTLRRAGLVSGGDETGDASLEAAFRATPYMLNSF
ncbi:UPF0256 protein [Microtetraspora sp. NBRC 13810]|uniref:GNAT family N-acetyltransferase n=1 Tax=Microtetraspora sp. NBRC 13810 TaxID=3030990 RepID=UPI0024A0A973|nr:GNAT family N-acetyltransferase [Microtetraspora sp. NBRC 13810]GLW06376.1 UPF0256 protein [Microtetraspora sp. NBRC 13810]